MRQPTIFVHIGMPKAASSYLQAHIFPQLMPEQYLMPGARNAKKSRYRFRPNAFAVRRFSDAFHRHSDFWRHHGEDFLKFFLSPFLAAGRGSKSVLISDEAITRLNHFNLKRMPDAYDRSEVESQFRLFSLAARRLGYARIKVLLITRRQDTLLASSYAQLSRKILGASQADFERRVHKLLMDSSNAETSFYSLDYESLHTCLVRSLSSSNVKLVPMEQISDDFPKFVDNVVEFLELEDKMQSLSNMPTNARTEGVKKWGLRPLLIFKSTQIFKSQNIDFEFTIPRYLTGRVGQIELTSKLSSDIMRHYAESNRNLNRVLDINFQRFGYC